jgi:hypothetical protein
MHVRVRPSGHGAAHTGVAVHFVREVKNCRGRDSTTTSFLLCVVARAFAVADEVAHTVTVNRYLGVAQHWTCRDTSVTRTLSQAWCVRTTCTLTVNRSIVAAAWVAFDTLCHVSEAQPHVRSACVIELWGHCLLMYACATVNERDNERGGRLQEFAHACQCCVLVRRLNLSG